MEESKVFLDRLFSHNLLEQLVSIGIKIVLVYLLLVALVFLERRIFKRLIERREKRSTDKTNLIFSEVL